MDYLCELPTDSARRRALNSLPPTLDATYARILRRVNESNHDVQIMVQRSLRWIAHAERALDVAELCEAISVNPGDTFLNREGIPAVEEILRCCSSLIRKSMSGSGLEFAHFTVKEYLQKIDEVADNEFGAYHIQPEPCHIELAEVCLTYLNLDDFGQVEVTDEEARTRRMKDYALRSYAVMEWRQHAGVEILNDRILDLIQRLFCPSKSINFITWAQDYNILLREEFYGKRDSDEFKFDAVNLCLAATGPLHYAAILAIPELCTWLLHEGCAINQRSPCGTPLQCTIFGSQGLAAGKFEMMNGIVRGKHMVSTFITLLESGADPNCYYDDGKGKLSLLGIVAFFRRRYLCLELLRHGAVVDEYARTQFRSWEHGSDDYSKKIFIGKFCRKDLEENDYANILERMLAFDEFERMDLSDSEQPVSELQYGDAINHLFLAAKFGQLGIITRLLASDSVNLNVTETETGRTALHYAAENDHSKVVALLLAHRAESNVVDSDGRTPIFLATKATEPHCFLDLLRQGCDISAKDLEGYTLIHHAARNGNIAALLALKERLEVSVASPCSGAVADPTTPLYAELGSGGEAEITPTGQNFLQAISEKSKKGETALHLAVEGGSLDVLRCLLDSNCDPKALMNDGSTALHCVAENKHLKQSHINIMNVLLEQRVDPCHPRCDGATPLHVMIQGSYHQSEDLSVSLEALKILARQKGTLLQTNAKGLTALHLFLRTCFSRPDTPDDAISWAKAALNLLLEAGADLQVVDPQNQSAFHYLLNTFTAPTTYSNPMTLSHMMNVVIDYAGKDETLIEMIMSPAVLVQAIKFGLLELMQKLLDRSPEVDVIAATLPAMTPIQAACHYRCDHNILRRMLDLSRARCDPAGLGSDLLRLVCERNDTEAYASALMLLEAEFDPSNQSSKGQNALMLAARGGNVDIVKLLIGREVDSSVSDAKGCNVAHYALEGGYVEVIHALEHCKLDWGAKGKMSFYGKALEGVTALHLAARLADSTLLEYLMNEKLMAYINCVTKDGVTPLFVAVWTNAPSNVAVLLSKKANVNIMATKSGESPLHMATRFGNRDIVSQLLRHGCDVTIPNKDGLDCQMIALKYGFKDLAQMIAEFAQKQGMFRSHTD